MGKLNIDFFRGLEEEDIVDTDNLVDTNLDDDGEIEPVITETEVEEDGTDPDADVVSVESFNSFFRGLEDDDILDETQKIEVSVNIVTDDASEDDGETDPVDDAADASEDDLGTEEDDDEDLGEESFSFANLY